MYKVDQAKNDPEGHRVSPIGVGPYRGSYNDNTAESTFTAQSNWWGEQPFIQVIRKPGLPETQTGYIMYENSEIDILFADSARQPGIWLPDNPFHNDLVDRGGRDGPSVWRGRFLNDHPPFDDINVRKAFSHGADMKTIVPALFGPKVEWAAGVVTQGNKCYQEGTGYEFDVEMARTFLAESQYGGPENLPSIKVEVSRPTMVLLFQALQQQWEENLGVQIEVVRLEPGQGRSDVTEFRRTAASHRHDAPDIILDRVISQIAVPQPELAAMAAAALDVGIADPAFCSTWQEVERAFLDGYWELPLNAGDNKGWAVQPWVMGYESSFGDGWPTVIWWKIGQRDRALYN